MALPKLNASRKVRTPDSARPLANPVTRTRNRLIGSLVAGLAVTAAILFFYTMPQYAAVKTANAQNATAKDQVTAATEQLAKAKNNPNISSLYYSGYQRYLSLLPDHDPNGATYAIYGLFRDPGSPLLRAGVPLSSINITTPGKPLTLAVPHQPALQYYQVAIGFTATQNQLQQALRNLANSSPLITVNSITSLTQTGGIFEFQGTVNIWFYPVPGIASAGR